MANYLIIGGDGKEYGPVTDADLRQWIAENRLNAQSLAKSEGDAEFRPLEKFPEFATAFAAATPGTIAPFRPAAGRPDQDYELDLGGCIARGWTLVKENMGVLLVGTLVYLLSLVAIGGMHQIPILGPLVALANLVISGPLMAGVFYLFIQAIRGEPVGIGNIFDGFRRGFTQLFLATLVQGLLVGLCLAPAIVVFVVKLHPLIGQLQSAPHSSPQAMMDAIRPILFMPLLVGLICALPAIYLSVSWKFTLPLIIDRQMEFWPAMQTSFKMVNRHWWQVFGLLILIDLVSLAGVLACCVGVVFTIPVGIAALMYAYETLFNAEKS